MRSSSSEATSSSAPRISSRSPVAQLLAGAAAPRVEPRLEQPHQQPGEPRVAEQHPLDVVLAERAAGLPQVLGVRAQHLGLLPAEPGGRDERVEAVVLHAPVPQRGERVLEQPAEQFGLDPVVARAPHAEVVDPGVPGGVVAVAVHLVGPLVDHLDAHALQQRQHLRQRDRRADAVELEPQLPVGGVLRLVQLGGDLVPRLGERLEHAQVGDGDPRREVRLVRLGEGRAVPADELGRVLLRVELADRDREVVLPGAGDLGEAALQLLDVDAVDVERPAALAADHQVHPGERGLADHGAVVERAAAKGVEQDLLQAQPYLRGEAVARQVDEAGDVAAVVVAAQEEPDLLALAQPQHAERDRQQLLDGDLEQLGAGEGLQDLDEVLAVVAGERDARAAQHLVQLGAQHRDAGDRLVVGDVGEQAEEAALADHLAGLVEQLHPDVVEVRRAVHGRLAVRLGDDEQALLADLGAQLGGHGGEALRAGAVGAQDAEPGAGERLERLAVLAVLQAVLAVAEEGEVVVGEPAQQLLGVRHHAAGQRRRVLAQLVGGADGERAHLLVVLDRAAHVLEHPPQVGFEPAQYGGAGLAVDLDVHPRLGERQAGDVAVLRAEQAAGEIAPDRQLGVDEQVHPDLVAVELHRHRVDEERHVVGDDLDHRAADLPAVGLPGRGVGPHQRAALGPVRGEPEVGEGRAADLGRVAADQVLGVDMPVEPGEQGERGVPVERVGIGRDLPGGLAGAPRTA
jgi:hypothetical protein